MAWKRSKDGGLDYDVSTELKYRETKRLLFDADALRDDRPKASWVIVHPEISDILEPKIGLKQRLKQRIKEGSLRT